LARRGPLEDPSGGSRGRHQRSFYRREQGRREDKSYDPRRFARRGCRGARFRSSIQDTAQASNCALRRASSEARSAQIGIIPSTLWDDPDLRWLTGFNEAEGHSYVNRESYEEMLWWLLLPELFKLVNMAVPTRSAASAIGNKVDKALAELEKAGYRVDALFKPEKPAGPSTPKSAAQPDASELVAVVLGSKSESNDAERSTEELEPEEPVAAKPVGPTNPDGPPENY